METSDEPCLYGIRRSNIRPSKQLAREMFPTTFSVALMNYMGDRGLPLNYIRIDPVCRTEVSEIQLEDVYGCPTGDIPDTEFCFRSVYDPFEEMAVHVPESDLVLRDARGVPCGRLDVRMSVVPDAYTRDLPPDQMAPEVNLTTRHLILCALSIAESLQSVSEEALSILKEGIPEGLDWSDWFEVGRFVERMLDNLDRLESTFHGLQRPIEAQAVWRADGDSPRMAEDAMDAFVWSDMALSRLFLDSGTRPKDGSCTRPLRASVRLYLILETVLEGSYPDLDALISMTRYGLLEGRECIMGGVRARSIMGCDNLVRPRVTATEAVCLGAVGFEDAIMPERRIELSVYLAAKALRG